MSASARRCGPKTAVAIVYREIGTLFWRGVRMTDVLLYWGGDERGNDFAVVRHDFPWCVPDCDPDAARRRRGDGIQDPQGTALRGRLHRRWRHLRRYRSTKR